MSSAHLVLCHFGSHKECSLQIKRSIRNLLVPRVNFDIKLYLPNSDCIYCKLSDAQYCATAKLLISRIYCEIATQKEQSIYCRMENVFASELTNELKNIIHTWNMWDCWCCRCYWPVLMWIKTSAAWILDKHILSKWPGTTLQRIQWMNGWSKRRVWMDDIAEWMN